jgi:hypothetical protein
VSGKTGLSSQFSRPISIKLSGLSADLHYVSANHHLPEEPIRSKGQATLFPLGYPELMATIFDISTSGIGVVARNPVTPDTPVDVHIHGHSAHGVVRQCQPQDDGFYLLIELAA